MKAIKHILKSIPICLCKNTHTCYVDSLLFKEKFWFKKNLLCILCVRLSLVS